MTDKQLRVRIAKDGTVAAETLGMKGEECLDYIQVLEALLEATTTDSQYTEDYAGSYSAVDDEIADTSKISDE
jgi:hypothetical protein